ncbi:Aquaporin-1 [Gnomoniopsis smithogilvyi]|uniref:Aquaporin-1 n=1 Tax=Gnomoniopsis smithogilvyi TaxID=1191159 RepID=A0A9W8YZU5_9PEZI|nr:Aquaporin-1 [Gnomoniopsis smithogilvyi]
MPHLSRVFKTSANLPCLPTAHFHKQRNESSGHNPLDVQDAYQNDSQGLQDITRRGSASSQGPINNFFGRWPDGIRGHTIAMLAEFIGTTTFLFFGFAAAQVANGKPDTLSANSDIGPSLLQIVYISWTFGISLAVNVWIFYRVSGGMFNPAVALGLWVAGAFNWIRLLCVIPMQLAGGVLAAGLVSAMFPGELQAGSSLTTPTTPAQGFFIEMMITAELVMTIIMLAVVKSRTSFMAPLSIGLALFIGHLIAIEYTGASMNPARTLGPALVDNTFESYFWIYFLGPCAGSLLAAGLYRLLKAMAYWAANSDEEDAVTEYLYAVPTKSDHVTRRNTADLRRTSSAENIWRPQQPIRRPSSVYDV